VAGEWTSYDVSALIESGSLVVGDGYRAKNSELTATGLPFARAGNINSGFLFDDADCFPEENIHRVGNKVSQPGDVVFTSKGTVGRFGFVRPETPKFVYSPQLCFWRSVDRELIDSRFLSFWMSGREFFIQFKGVAGQTDMAEYVSLTDQRRMHITLPPVPEQRAIAHILGTLDDKIELNRRMNETLEAMARALFSSWFVDFDPVRAKAEGRAPGLPKPLTDLFPDSFEDSELGQIPRGWRVLRWGDLVTLE
jgi:type I restriction enzyme S subunit